MYPFDGRRLNGLQRIGYIIRMAAVRRVRPRIAIVADRRVASFGAWSDVELASVWMHYVEAIDSAGGIPVIVPIARCFDEDPALALEAIDGLLLTGGRDLDASSYGADPDPENEEGDALRDRIELAIAHEALERDMPLLGVCRGMQLLNVALGGGIDQHLADPDAIHRAEPGAFVDHPIETVAGSRLADILGAEPDDVRSHHHQGVAPLASAFTVSARSPDGLVEAVEVADRSFCVAVLWHPEENLEAGGAKLYEALVDASRSAHAAAEDGAIA
jgi:putative glutamine amidotransferase